MVTWAADGRVRQRHERRGREERREKRGEEMA
jgi:hypothetical protein